MAKVGKPLESFSVSQFIRKFIKSFSVPDSHFSVFLAGKSPFQCLVGPRLGFHFLPKPVDLERFTGVSIFVHQYSTPYD